MDANTSWRRSAFLLRNLAVGVPIFSALTPFYLSTGIKTNKLSLFPWYRFKHYCLYCHCFTSYTFPCMGRRRQDQPSQAIGFVRIVRSWRREPWFHVLLKCPCFLVTSAGCKGLKSALDLGWDSLGEMLIFSVLHWCWAKLGLEFTESLGCLQPHRCLGSVYLKLRTSSYLDEGIWFYSGAGWAWLPMTEVMFWW